MEGVTIIRRKGHIDLWFKCPKKIRRGGGWGYSNGEGRGLSLGRRKAIGGGEKLLVDSPGGGVGENERGLFGKSHPGGSKRLQLELGVGENSGEAQEGEKQKM